MQSEICPAICRPAQEFLHTYAHQGFAMHKVLQFTPAVFGENGYVGGGERYVHSIAKSIARARPDAYSCRIVGLGEKSISYWDEDIRVTVLRGESMSGSYLERMSPDLWRHVSSADILHVHQPFCDAGLHALLVGGQLGKLVVATDHGAGSGAEIIHRKALKIADAIISVSNFSTKLLLSNSQLDDVPVDVIVGPVEQKFFSVKSFRRTPTVLYLGRLLPHKGVDRIIRALPSGLKLVVAGAADPASGYLAHLKELVGEKDVSFRINPSDVEIERLYGEATVYCIASTFTDYLGNKSEKPELMGITTMEALASGCAVLVSSTASLPEIVSNSSRDFARVFDADEELAQVLIEIREKKWPALGYEVHSRAFAERYSPQDIGLRICAVYDKLLEGRSK